MDEKPTYFEFNKEIITPDDAEEAAKKIRAEWDLGYDPIPDVVAMLEDKGYKVIEINAPEKFDGLSADVDELKVIVLNGSLYEGNNCRSRGYHKNNNEPGNYLSQEKPVRFLRLVYFALGKGLISVNEAAYYSGESVWEFRKSMKQLA